jgi:CheY-like chemotaxis protein
VFKATNRAIDLVRQILSISRQTEQERKPIRIETVIRDVIQLLKATLPASIVITENINEKVGLTKADSGQIHQVLMNLGTNAGQAMREKGGTLTISLDSETINSGLNAGALNLKPGLYLKATVSDTGCGILPKDRKRIFDPYYTTKDKGMGTGLGLAVVQGIVRKHGGAITFSSRVGTGTDFHVYLPMITPAEKKEYHEKLKSNMALPHGEEKILLVDDEQTIIDTGREMLEYLGYTVKTCRTGTDALKMFEETPEGFDLIISDMTMPGMNGDRLAKKLIEIRPDIPVVICTGFNPQIDEESARKIGVKAFIFKPLTFEKLALLVRKVIDE